MQALVPPGGGPPPHIHTREEETFYVLEGNVEEVAARYDAAAPRYGIEFV